MSSVEMREADDGAVSVEYALLAAFIAAVITAAVVLLGLDVTGLYASVAGNF